MTERPTLGTKIRRARERKRWTQKRLATELSVGVRTVNDWENDRSYPRNSVGALEEVLGVRLDEEPGEPVIPADIEAAIRRSVRPENQEKVRQAIRDVLSEPDDPDVEAHGPLGAPLPSPAAPGSPGAPMPPPAGGRPRGSSRRPPAKSSART